MSEMIRTIIIDDEDNVRDVLRRMLDDYCPGIKTVGEANGVRSGIEAIRKYQPGLVLLDIKMGDGTGFDLLNLIDRIDFKVIFVTAFEEYAIKAFKFSALDYILKPVDPDELMKAVEKTEKVLQHEFQMQISAFNDNIDYPERSRKKLVLKTIDNIYLLKLADINYCESDGAYTRFHTVDGREIMVSRGLKEFEDILAEQGFFRVHKSYLINLTYIVKFEKNDGGFVIMDNEARVPVSTRKRELLLDLFDKLSK